MKIHHLEEPNKGAFIATENDIEAGKMTYSKAGENRIIIDHTEVNSNFRGQSVGKKLLLETVAFARKNQIKILPLCPFAKSMFDRDEKLHDVLSYS